MLTGPNSASLAYDPAMRLYQTVGAGITTRFGYDGADLIGEYNSSNTLLRRYVHGPGTDEPLVWYEGSGTTDRRWLHADERGSVIAISNGSGTVTSINAYDEYGIPAATNVGRFGYTGQTWLPEVGLNYYKARIYSPTLGRFMQNDPIGYGDGMNIYNYVGSDPVNGRDPTGLEETTTGPDIIVIGRNNRAGIRSFLNPIPLPPVTLGQDADSGSGESTEDAEIIVTAQRRENPIQNPIELRSITPLSVYLHYTNGTGQTACLTEDQFKDIVRYSNQTGISVKISPNRYRIPIETYSSGRRLGYSIGNATIYADTTGQAIGFYDYADYDSKTWGERSIMAEIVTRAGNIGAPNGKGFSIKYPCY